MLATEQPDATQIVSQILLPEGARVLSSLARIDYEDAFAVTSDVHYSSEQWVRAMLQDAPASVRWRLWLGWIALGLKLAPPWSSGHVLGWKVQQHSDADFVLLTADSRLGLRGQLLFRGEPHRLLFATFVQQTNPAARALWRAITPRHQHIVRSLLEHAARRVPTC